MGFFTIVGLIATFVFLPSLLRTTREDENTGKRSPTTDQALRRRRIVQDLLQQKPADNPRPRKEMYWCFEHGRQKRRVTPKPQEHKERR
jgi:hypothetical protein